MIFIFIPLKRKIGTDVVHCRGIELCMSITDEGCHLQITSHLSRMLSHSGSRVFGILGNVGCIPKEDGK